MSEPTRLTRDALEALLGELDRAALAAFVADLYERMGWTVERDGQFLTASKGGDAERLFVRAGERTRLARLLGRDRDLPKPGTVDAIVTPERDAAVRAVAEEGGARVVDAAEIHDRLLYAIDRDACRDLCRRHFGRGVDPRPAPDPGPQARSGSSDGSRSRALLALGLCGVLVVAAAGLIGVPGGTAPAPEPQDAPETPVGAGLVTPAGGAVEPTPTPTAPALDPPVFAFLTEQPLYVAPGSSAVIEGLVSAPSNRSYTNVSVSLGVPSEKLRVAPMNGTRVGTLEPGARRGVAWLLEAEVFASHPYPLNVEISYERAKGNGTRQFEETYTFLIVSQDSA